MVITEFSDTEIYLVGSGYQQVGSVINYLRLDYKLSDIDMYVSSVLMIHILVVKVRKIIFRISTNLKSV